MPQSFIRAGLALAAVMLVACLLLPSTASAEELYRTFTGRVDRINKKQMIVDNRMGDKVKFMFKKGATEVSGTKTTWRKVKMKDWVTVSWKFTDKPRIAYKVEVFEKEGEDDE